MIHDKPPFSLASVYSDPKRLGEAIPLVGTPFVRALNWPYRPWRKVRPMARQQGLSPEATWFALKMIRSGSWRDLDLDQMGGASFGLCSLPPIFERLHRIDQSLGGGLPSSIGSDDGSLADQELRKRLVVRTLMDEAIDSSRIEGAVTTRKRALELLRSGASPADKSERMVVNNYSAMQWVNSKLREPLSVDMLLELQCILTRGTMEDPSASGRLRIASDQVVIVDERSGEEVFVPPAAEQLPQRLDALCKFANDSHTGDRFLHPIVKACILHFMVGYEHPFVDGNGRTARAVFYWYVLRSGYRIFEFLVISELILKAFAKYPQAYIDTEDDDGDLTYFVAYKLDVIERSIARFHEYLSREQEQIERSLLLVRRFRGLNLRQRLLLEHALKHPKSEYTAKSYATTNAITPQTARSDLETLRKRRLLSSFRVAKAVHYVPSPDLQRKLGHTPA